jgi:phosphoglycolate phosphatase
MIPMDYDLIIFDFDYTLGDSTRGIFASVNYALAKLGFGPADLPSVCRLIGLSLQETFFQLTQIKDENLCKAFIRLFSEKADEVMTECTVLFPYTLPILRQIKARNIKTSIVTTKFHYRVDQILRKYEATSLIDLVVGNEDVTNSKPSPEGLLFALASLRVKKERALYIGDSIVDAMAAASANISFMAVTTGTTGQADFQRFPYVAILDDLSHLPL